MSDGVADGIIAGLVAFVLVLGAAHWERRAMRRAIDLLHDAVTLLREILTELRNRDR